MNSPLPDMSAHWQESLNWLPDSMQQATFGLLYDEMLRVNRQFNLTRITEPLEFWEKHLWDSLSGIEPWLREESPWQCLDIGTGGGFPGLPIAIVRPTWQVTLLDSTRKKITFIQQMIETLGLSNAKGLVDRVEHLGHNPQHREFYDLATIRAVASAAVCAEYALPMLKLAAMPFSIEANGAKKKTKPSKPPLKSSAAKSLTFTASPRPYPKAPAPASP